MPLAETEALRAARLGSLAPQLQVAASVEPGGVQQDRLRQSNGQQPDTVAPLQPVAALTDAPANRYRYKIAHAPDLDRPLLQMVDEKTNQIVVSLPPEQLARMLEDAKALVEERLTEPGIDHLDTSV